MSACLSPLTCSRCILHYTLSGALRAVVAFPQRDVVCLANFGVNRRLASRTDCSVKPLVQVDKHRNIKRILDLRVTERVGDQSRLHRMRFVGTAADHQSQSKAH